MITIFGVSGESRGNNTEENCLVWIECKQDKNGSAHAEGGVIEMKITCLLYWRK